MDIYKKNGLKRVLMFFLIRIFSYSLQCFFGITIRVFCGPVANGLFDAGTKLS